MSIADKMEDETNKEADQAILLSNVVAVIGGVAIVLFIVNSEPYIKENRC